MAGKAKAPALAASSISAYFSGVAMGRGSPRVSGDLHFNPNGYHRSPNPASAPRQPPSPVRSAWVRTQECIAIAAAAGR